MLCVWSGRLTCEGYETLSKFGMPGTPLRGDARFTGEYSRPESCVECEVATVRDPAEGSTCLLPVRWLTHRSFTLRFQEPGTIAEPRPFGD
jgi:hypothetical protein